MSSSTAYVIPLAEVTIVDRETVGGKSAALGELHRTLATAGIRVPDGFTTTAAAFRLFCDRGQLAERIAGAAADLEPDLSNLAAVGSTIRAMILAAPMPGPVERAIRGAYRQLAGDAGGEALAVAVRSSATTEDLEDASFAGQQESYLNVVGADRVVDRTRHCFASLFTDRAIAYRIQNGYDVTGATLAVCIQRMVRSDQAASGVVFTLDPESGFRDVVVVNSAWGLGEAVVQGQTEPDEFMVHRPLLDRRHRPIIERRLGAKSSRMVYADDGGTALTRTAGPLRDRFSLDDDEVLRLADWAVRIERLFGRPMDIEWAKDGEDGGLYVTQARPETVQSQRSDSVVQTYDLEETGEVIVTGSAVGDGVAVGEVRRLDDPGSADGFRDGDILVTAYTDPDWMPVLRRAGGIVTDHGGRTSHAAIVSRELGLPAVVGTGHATGSLSDGEAVTVSCCEGATGRVYRGPLPYTVTDRSFDDVPETRTRVMLNLADPEAAFRWWRLPADGIGLARMEFIVSNLVQAHPMALIHPERVDDASARRIRTLARGYPSLEEFLVETMAMGIARIAAPFHPKPAIVRFSDFKTNEYADLIGGSVFEPVEENPMLGWRGASRYHHPDYREAFSLELEAVRRVRERIGMTNVAVMIPFCRTPEEADAVLELMAEQGLDRQADPGLRVYLMCELPTNVIQADRFAARVDGFSIGSNDLTQLLLGVDRDSDRLSALFDERDPSVLEAIRQVTDRAHRQGRTVGICGQAPSDYPEFARRLVGYGLDSLSVAPDVFLQVKSEVADVEGAIVHMADRSAAE